MNCGIRLVSFFVVNISKVNCSQKHQKLILESAFAIIVLQVLTWARKGLAKFETFSKEMTHDLEINFDNVAEERYENR